MITRNEIERKLNEHFANQGRVNPRVRCRKDAIAHDIYSFLTGANNFYCRPHFAVNWAEKLGLIKRTAKDPAKPRFDPKNEIVLLSNERLDKDCKFFSQWFDTMLKGKDNVKYFGY